jgi:hypothetical protein
MKRIGAPNREGVTNRTNLNAEGFITDILSGIIIIMKKLKGL